MKQITFSVRELEYLLRLAKDRKFKVDLGDLHYSQYFLQIESKIAANLIEKLQDSINTFTISKEKAV